MSCKPLYHLAKGPNRSDSSWSVTGILRCCLEPLAGLCRCVAAQTLRLWRKALLSLVDNYTPFEKQLSVCSWALLETEHLAMDHQINMWLELPIISWVLSDPLNIKLGVHSITGLSNGRSIYKMRLEQALKAQEVTWEGGPNAKAPNPATLLFLSQPSSMAPWGVTYYKSTEEENTWAWFTGGCIRHAGTPWKWTAVALHFLSGTSLKDSG